MFAPGALLRRDVLEVAGGYFARVAFGEEAAVVEPPDFVGDLVEKFEVVGGEENGGSATTEAVDAGDGAGADESVGTGQRVIEGEGGDGGELQHVERAEVAGGGVETDFAGLRRFEAGGEAEELADTAGILADYAD